MKEEIKNNDIILGRSKYKQSWDAYKDKNTNKETPKGQKGMIILCQPNTYVKGRRGCGSPHKTKYSVNQH